MQMPILIVDLALECDYFFYITCIKFNCI